MRKRQVKDATKTLIGLVERYGGLAEAIKTGDIEKCMCSAAAKENAAKGQKSGYSPFEVHVSLFSSRAFPHTVSHTILQHYTSRWYVMVFVRTPGASEVI